MSEVKGQGHIVYSMPSIQPMHALFRFILIGPTIPEIWPKEWISPIVSWHATLWMVGHKARLRELHFWIFHGTVFVTWERSGEYVQNSLGIIQILTTGRHHGELGATTRHKTHFLRMEWPEYKSPYIDDFQHFHLYSRKHWVTFRTVIMVN